MPDSLELAREREPKARELLKEASQNPGLDPCDDAWMTAAIFQRLLDEEREKFTKLEGRWGWIDPETGDFVEVEPGHLYTRKPDA